MATYYAGQFLLATSLVGIDGKEEKKERERKAKRA